MRIAVLGGNGLLGADLVKFFSSPKNKVTAITRDTYEKNKGKQFDLFINASGNSKRFWALQNVLSDFDASTSSVYKTLFNFKSKQYIYISSVDVYPNPSSPRKTLENQEMDITKQNSYGFHKYLSEQIIKKHTNDWIVLRCSMVLGTNIKKGPFFDILNNNPIFISKSSKLQIITTKALSQVIMALISKRATRETFNIGGRGTFAFAGIDKYFNRRVEVSKDAKRQVYEMNVNKIRKLFPTLKTSEQYLQEFLNG